MTPAETYIWSLPDKESKSFDFIKSWLGHFGHDFLIFLFGKHGQYQIIVFLDLYFI